MGLFFKKKLFNSGNSMAVLLPKPVIDVFLKEFSSRYVKVSYENNKIIIESYNEENE